MYRSCTYFVKIIPNCLHIYVLINGIFIFYGLLICRNTVGFFILILYPETLLNFFEASLGFPTHIMLTTNKDNFTFFSNLYAFYFSPFIHCLEPAIEYTEVLQFT